MKEAELFSQCIAKMTALAKEQGNVISKEQIETILTDAGLSMEEAQLTLIYEYLKGQKIGIGKPADPFDYMTEEEIDYLDSYLEELKGLPEASEGEKEAITLSAMAGDPDAKARLIEIFLPEVAEIARLYAGQGVYMEDLIGEGNVSLTMAVEMLDTAENAKQAMGSIVSMIMEAMETYIGENAEEKTAAETMAGKANEVLERAKEMAESLGRKITAEELSEETGMSIGKIKEAMRITADNIDYLTTEEF